MWWKTNSVHVLKDAILTALCDSGSIVVWECFSLARKVMLVRVNGKMDRAKHEATLEQNLKEATRDLTLRMEVRLSAGQ